ncbi:hypothetical protein ES703_49640 [subsurface metagenome]
MCGAVKVITWNLGYWQHRPFHEDAWNYLREEVKPDLALLQEVKPPLLNEGERLLFKPVHGGWGTATYSRCSPLVELGFVGYPGRVATAQLECSGVKINAASIHAPIIEGRVFPHLDRIFDEIEALMGAMTFIVGGDLNSARLAEKVWPGYGHGPFFVRLADSPFFDCMMEFHDEEQQTYFRHDVTRPWQDDHLFVSHNLAEKVVSCEVLNNDITKRVSDHRPILAEINL